MNPNRRENPVNNPNARNARNLIRNADEPQQRRAATKQKKRRLDLLGREKKKVKTKGWEEKLLSKLLKKKKKIGADLTTFKNEYDEAAGESNIPENQYQFFFKFLRTTTDVRKLPITKNLFLRPVLIPLYQIVNLDYITNDSLFWYFWFSSFRNLNYVNVFGNISHIYLCSNKLVRFDVETKLNEYFIEDFNVSISSPLWNTQANTQVNDFQATEEFTVFGKTYRVYTVAGNGSVIALNTINVDDIIRQLNAQKIIHMKGKLSEGVREIKKTGDFFYNSKIKLTDFCPSVLRSFNQTQFSCLCFFEVDPNSFVDRCKITNSFIVVPNLIYWDYLHSSMELIGVIKLTTNILDGGDEFITRIRNAYISYVENKTIFSDYKAHFMLFKKIVLTFLDSFRVRANVDKMKEISKLCEQFINEDDRLDQFPEQKSIVRMFCINTRELCTMMFNYFAVEPLRYIVLVNDVCRVAYNSTKNPGELSNKLRAVCLQLSDLLYNGSKPLIDSIRSVNAFLGSVSGGQLDAISELSQRLIGQAVAVRGNLEDVARRRMRDRAGGVLQMNDILRRSIPGLIAGKQDDEILNDQNIMRLINTYFDGLKIYNDRIPQDDAIYNVLSNRLRQTVDNRFAQQNLDNDDVRRIIYENNRIEEGRLDLMDLEDEEEDDDGIVIDIPPANENDLDLRINQMNNIRNRIRNRRRLFRVVRPGDRGYVDINNINNNDLNNLNPGNPPNRVLVDNDNDMFARFNNLQNNLQNLQNVQNDQNRVLDRLNRVNDLFGVFRPDNPFNINEPNPQDINQPVDQQNNPQNINQPPNQPPQNINQPPNQGN